MKALAAATGIVFWTLVLGTAWLVFFPGSDSGEPVAVLQIEPATVTSAPEPPAGDPFGTAGPAPGEDSDVDLPPGFAVTGPAEAPVPPAPEQPVAPPELPQPDDAAPSMDEAAPPTPDFDQQGALPGSPEAAVQAAASPHVEPVPVKTETVAGEAASEPVAEQTAAISPAVVQGAAPSASPEVEEETASIALSPVPIPALVEHSPYGPLPRVALDGKRPAEAYARPSRYAAAAMGGGPARVAVLLNGLGLPDAPDSDALEGLPAPVSVAYAAYGRSLQELVTKARDAGHEVLLQIPLEPENYPTEDPGPHTLLTTLPPEENVKRLQWLMSRYTGYVGVTNLMGARFETTREAFLPVLEEVKRRGLLYLDDGSVKGSAGEPIASTIGLDYAAAHVRLDEKGIAKGLAELESVARERGAAIGVAKAKAATVRQITDWADKLEAKGLVLVPVSAAMRSQRQS